MQKKMLNVTDAWQAMDYIPNSEEERLLEKAVTNLAKHSEIYNNTRERIMNETTNEARKLDRTKLWGKVNELAKKRDKENLSEDELTRLNAFNRTLKEKTQESMRNVQDRINKFYKEHDIDQLKGTIKQYENELEILKREIKNIPEIKYVADKPLCVTGANGTREEIGAHVKPVSTYDIARKEDLAREIVLKNKQIQAIRRMHVNKEADMKARALFERAQVEGSKKKIIKRIITRKRAHRWTFN